MALIRMCVVLNCSQRLSQPFLWIVAVCVAYWTHTTAVCLLMVVPFLLIYILCVNIIVTVSVKTILISTCSIMRKTNLKYSSCCGSVVLDFSHARFTV